MSLGAGLLAFGAFFMVFFAVALVVEILFLLNLMETLRRVSHENRRMTPGLVWLILIPVFGMGWFIYTVIRISDSLRAEYRSRGWQPEGDFGYGVGLAAGIINIAGLAWGWIPRHGTVVGALLSVGYLVCWIMYWVRTARIKNRLGPAAGWAGTAGPYSGYGPPPGPGGWQAPGGWQGAGGPAGPGMEKDRKWAQSSGDEDGNETGGESGDEAGDPTRQAARCSACGTAVTPDDKYCRGCGSPL